MNSKLDAYFCLSGAMVLVGSAVVVGKVITQAFPLFLASSLRFALAAGVLTPYVLIWGGGFKRISRGDWLLLACMAFCGQVVFTLFLLWGLRMTSALDAGLITSTTPAAMAIMALLILGERLRAKSALGVTLAVSAVAVVNLMGGVDSVTEAGQGAQRWLGNLLVSGAVLGEAVFLLVRKRLTPGIPNLTVAAALCILGLAMSLPLGLLEAGEFDFTLVSLGIVLNSVRGLAGNVGFAHGGQWLAQLWRVVLYNLRSGCFPFCREMGSLFESLEQWELALEPYILAELLLREKDPDQAAIARADADQLNDKLASNPAELRQEIESRLVAFTSAPSPPEDG